MTAMAAAMEATQTMKAIVRRRWGRARDVVELVDIPKPEPADDEVLVRVHTSSINRSDYYALGGGAVLMRPMIGGFLRPKDERIGGDFAGIAEAVGKDVTDVEPGDEVFGARAGAFAQYVAAKNAVARKPANLSFEETAAVPVAALGRSWCTSTAPSSRRRPGTRSCIRASRRRSTTRSCSPRSNEATSSSTTRSTPSSPASRATSRRPRKTLRSSR